jgi:hypothetical protein
VSRQDGGEQDGADRTTDEHRERSFGTWANRYAVHPATRWRQESSGVHILLLCGQVIYPQ